MEISKTYYRMLGNTFQKKLRSSHSELFLKIGVSVKLAKVLKNACEGVHFFVKLQTKACNFTKNELLHRHSFKDFAKIFSYFSSYFEKLGTAIFLEHLSVVTSENLQSKSVDWFLYDAGFYWTVYPNRL